MTDLHIVYTDAGDSYGWTIESPQIPELIGGRDTAEAVLADTEEIVKLALDEGAEFDHVYRHEQHLTIDPAGREYLIRWQFNADDHPARYDTATRLNSAVSNGLMDDDEISQQPQLPTTGERLLIAVVGTDTLGWIQGQLSQRVGCCVLVQGLGEGALLHVPFGLDGLLGPRQRYSTAELGLSEHSTFQELADALLASEIEDLKKTVLPPGAVGAIRRHMPVAS